VCVCEHMYLCMYVCIHVFMYICMYVRCVFIHVFYVHMYMCIHVFVYICVYVFMCLYMYVLSNHVITSTIILHCSDLHCKLAATLLNDMNVNYICRSAVCEG